LAVAYVLKYDAFAGMEHCTPARPLRCDCWSFPAIGWPALTIHPVHVVTEDSLHVVALWQARQGGGHLPDAGGLNDQAAWLMHAFAVCDVAAQRLCKGSDNG
jgi:hypothetical protein